MTDEQFKELLSVNKAINTNVLATNDKLDGIKSVLDNILKHIKEQ